MGKRGGRFIKIVVPWAITVGAIFYVLRGVDWNLLLEYLRNANPGNILAAIALTVVSYMLRARRWQSLFPRPVISYANSLQVLVLGFFMNNILPARTGEFVRAHLGAKVTGERRTLVLATIASERLADGLALSIMFVLFSLKLGDQGYSENLFYVACAFAAVSFGVVALLASQSYVFRLMDYIGKRRQTKMTHYLTLRARVFIEGLSPLLTWRGILSITLWSAVIWLVELLVYRQVTEAYSQPLSIPVCVLFMVTSNFSSLIPAAPGGLGVIEAAATAVLVSIGIEHERALTMVLTQHVLQYLVVGFPGLFFLSRWKKTIKNLEEDRAEQV